MPDLKKMLTLEALSEAPPSWLKRSTKPEYNADEIDSTLTTNQFVTASDKDNWNAKGTYSKPSGGIPKSDLSSIVQTSLEKADSALQSETDPTVPSWAKQTNKPSYTQDEVADGTTYKKVTQTEKNTWNGKQNALTTPQMNAVNSGITSEGVAQISTNQANIWLVNKYGGGKNYINSNDLDVIKALNTTGWTWNNNVAQKNSVSFTVNKDGTIKVNGTPSALTEFKLPIDHQTEIDGTSVLSTGILNTGDNPMVMRYSGGSYVVPDNYGYVNIPANTVATEIIIQVRTTGTAPSNLLYKPMLCITEDWDASHDYQPYANSNPELTAALAEEIDAGAKNAFDWSKVDLVDRLSVSNGVFTTTCTDTQTNLRFSLNGLNSSKGIVEYFIGNASRGYQVITTNGIYAFPFTMKSNIVYLRFGHNGAQQNGRGDINVQHLTVGKTYIFVLNITQCSSSTSTFKWQDVMICTLADWKVSQKVVPYRYDPYTTVWQNLANATLYARRNGRTVTINGYVDNLSFTSGTALTLGTINDEIGKPVQQIRALCNIGSNAYSIGEIAYLTVGTDGQLKVTPKTYSGTGAVFLSFAYAF